MDDQAPIRTVSRRRRRLLLKGFVFLVLPAVAVVAALPWLLGTPPARRWLVGKVNGRLAPGSIEVQGLSLSWTRPIGLSGVALRDPKGKVVVAARSVRFDRGLLGVLRSRPDYGTITLDGATVDVERRLDGSIDAIEALGSALDSDPSKPSDPGTAVVVNLKGGPVRVASPELVEPIAAATAEGSVRIAPGKPMELDVALVEAGQLLELRATYDHRAPADVAGDRSLAVSGKGWPIHVRRLGVEARGRYEGMMEARREKGRWSIKGDAALVGVEATGPALAGDRLALDRLAAECDAGQTPAGWSVRKLDVEGGVASLSAAGTWPASEGAKLHGRADLAALARMMPRAMRLKDGLTLDRGTATVRVDVTSVGTTDRAELTASLDDLAARQGGRPLALREPARLAASAVRSGGVVKLEKVVAKAAGVDVTASGDLDAGVRLEGTVDLAALDAQARDLLDLGALAVSGHARLGADYRHVGDTYKIRLGADCKALHLAGLTAAPIDRDLSRFDASASGPRSADGRPAGWHEAQLDLKSGDAQLDVIAKRQGSGFAVVASGGLDVASPTPGRATAKASFVMTGRAFEVYELLAGITPTDPASAPGALGLAVKGRLDLATGEGSFVPLPGSRAGAVGLMAEGIQVSGLGRADLPLRVDAAMLGDLAALDRLMAAWSGSPPRGLAGIWGAHFKVTRSTAGRVATGGRFDVPDITAPGLNGPFSMAWDGAYSAEGDRLDLAGLDLKTGYAQVGLAGTMYEARGRRICDLKATVTPRWEAIDPIVAASVEPAARFRATVRPIHWKGVMRADSTARLIAQQVAEIGLDVTEAKAFGVTLGAAPVVLRLGGGGAVFDPIRTTANGGPVAINADLAFDQAGGAWLRLLPGTKIEGAEINDAVSTAVLAYVAPVLAHATEVNGKVSVDIAQAALPITATGSTAIDGRVVFEGVQFRPGPLGDQVASLAGRPAPKLVLHQPMKLQVADGRVKQSGLSIPLVGGAKVDLDGSVGFDKTLDLRATVPLTARMLGLDPKFEKVVGGSKLAVPIRGTMARPAIDGRAFGVALRDAARAAAGRGIQAEAAGLLDRVAGPNPPGGGEPRAKPGRNDALGELENLGRGLLDQRKQP